MRWRGDRRGLRGVAVVEPDIADGEVRALDDAGIRGVRFNLVDHNGERNVVSDRRRCATLANAIAPFGWHIEFLVNLDEAPRFQPAIDELPVDVVVGHLGYREDGAGPGRAPRASTPSCGCSQSGRCWVKLTGPYRISAAPDLPYRDVTPLARALRRGQSGAADLGHRLAARHDTRSRCRTTAI